MSDIAIRVENLSKLYRIGASEQRQETLMGAVASFLSSPLKNYRTLRKLSQFDDVKAEARISKSEDGKACNFHYPSCTSGPADVFWALRDVSFEVKHGEVLGLIGRNGAGKSTLLKILARITEPSSGLAEIHGRVGSLLEVGTGFHPDLTGRENVYLNGTILGMKKREIDKRFEQIVEFSGIEKFIETPVKRYSSGMRVRLAFSVAAHLEPEILLVDEVLAVGDAEFQQKCLGKMGEVSKEGRTVLFVSHNMAAIESLCPRIICLDQGKVSADGSTDAVIPRYLQLGATDSAEVDLLNHPGRGPGLRPVLYRLTLRDTHGVPSHVFRLDDTLVFEVELNGVGIRYLGPRVSLAVFNSLGAEVCRLATWARPIRWETLEAQTRLQCIWPSCRLTPGRYSVSLAFGAPDRVDSVEYALSFSIESADVYGSGKIGTGVFVPDFDWRLCS